MVNLGSELEDTTHASTVETSMHVNKVPPAKQSTSARKSQANRRNALRSTGPKTPQGKRHSRMNALKHALSAEAVFEEYVSVNENADSYNDLRQRLQQHYKPVGAAEELEVERIARCWWKLDRASRYEDAEIRFGTLKAALGEPADAQAIIANDDQALGLYLYDVHENIERGGEVPPDLEQRVLADPLLQPIWPDLEKRAETLVNSLAELDAQTRKGKIDEEKKSIQQNPDLAQVSWRDFVKANLHTPGGRARLIALVTIKQAMRHLQKLHDETRDFTLTLSLHRQAIPTGEALERVLRYESAAERHLARAIDRLERLQRQRRGELLPPPLNVNLGRRN